MVEARRRANQARWDLRGMKAHLNLTARTYEASKLEDEVDVGAYPSGIPSPRWGALFVRVFSRVFA